MVLANNTMNTSTEIRTRSCYMKDYNLLQKIIYKPFRSYSTLIRIPIRSDQLTTSHKDPEVACCPRDENKSTSIVRTLGILIRLPHYLTVNSLALVLASFCIKCCFLSLVLHFGIKCFCFELSSSRLQLSTLFT